MISLKVKLEAKEVDANGWVQEGTWFTAHLDSYGCQELFDLGIKGSPCGRSQRSFNGACEDLVNRIWIESQIRVSIQR